MSKQKFVSLGLLMWLLAFGKAVDARSASATDSLKIAGLHQPVEIFKDPWGISHIYAKNQADLFFAQGFNVARDRLFQLEMWRRQATGTLAEILGRRELKRDIGARLLKFRLDIDQEMAHYHPRGKEIITSFVRGINAYIDLTRRKPELLPMEFRLLGILPQHWTPEIVISRHNGLFRNARTEILLARVLQKMDAKALKEVLNLHPGSPTLQAADGLDLSLISDKILELYTASRARIQFTPENIVDPKFRAAAKAEQGFAGWFKSPLEIAPNAMDIGSNNWVVSGKNTFTGHAVMANDPHRSQQIPSLRYWVHLVAPGWNVIGGGEPALPGVSIGHNAFGAWGLTIFPVDQEDIYVYETHPENPDLYKYRGNWQPMKIIRESIPVKNEAPVSVELKFTRHGPVLYEDREHHRAYALRAAWLEIGSAPYLASLRMDQARSWQEFREACSYSRTPSENMVWADVEGNIGWQAVGIAPLRRGWSGLLPVPGDGRFEWDGYLPIKSLPHVLNPREGFWATANQDNLPPGYPYPVGYLWADPYRFARIQEVLGSGRKVTLMDHIQLQQDFLSIPSRNLVPLLKGLKPEHQKARKAQNLLLDWDNQMEAGSMAAAIYMSWEKRLYQNVADLYIPKDVQKIGRLLSLQKMIEHLTVPDDHFGENPVAGRDSLLLASLDQALSDLNRRLGPDMRKWRYGQKKYHHIQIRHLLSPAVKGELRKKLDVGPLPRGGNSYTVNNTTSNDNQTAGPSFRIIADTGDWDNSVGTNTPGQSGNPDSIHYRDLFKMWANGHYFPVYYSREKVVSVAEKVTRLLPSDAAKKAISH